MSECHSARWQSYDDGRCTSVVSVIPQHIAKQPSASAMVYSPGLLVDEFCEYNIMSNGCSKTVD